MKSPATKPKRGAKVRDMVVLDCGEGGSGPEIICAMLRKDFAWDFHIRRLPVSKGKPCSET